MSKIVTKWIADDAVTAAKVNADVAGDGLAQGGTGELDVSADSTGGSNLSTVINVSANGVAVKTDDTSIDENGSNQLQIAATGVTAAKLGNDVAGNGLTGGNGSALDVEADSTGGTNLATVINVSTNGVAVKIDDDTIGENGSNRLYVKANSIGATEIDETEGYTWTGAHDFTGGTVTVATPSTGAQAVNKTYADGLLNGFAFKAPVQAMADSDQTLSGLPTNIDGVTSWAVDDRVLLTNQDTASENGIWEVQSSTWSRPEDFDTDDHAAGAATWVNEGDDYADTQWTCTNDPPNDVIDTDNLTFVQTSGAGQVTAGVGLTKDGNTINIGDGSTGNINGIALSADAIAAAVDTGTMEIASNLINVKNLGIDTAQLAATSVTAAKLGSDVAGDGLTGGNGADLDVEADSTGGTNLATVINVSSNGVAVKIDDSTIGENGSNQLYVPNGGITETQLNASVAGNGISGGAGTALAMDINGIAAASTSADDADLIAIYDDTETGLRKMTRANFLSGVSGENIKQEMHLVTSGEVTAGFFTLSETADSAQSVRVTPVGGPHQVSKQVVGATGATPDFDVGVDGASTVSINNNGSATGLSGDIEAADVLICEYAY